MTLNKGKALILIPCCKSNSVKPGQDIVVSLPGLSVLREQLLNDIRNTPNLEVKVENRRGILNPTAGISRAINLYCGGFYKQAGQSLQTVAGGNLPSIEILIVSAFYGLVLSNEGIKEYELQMADSLGSGQKVYQFWQNHGLWQILLDYTMRYKISHLWSLLPDSVSSFPYQQVFREYWKMAGDKGVRCFHVLVPGAGTSTGYQRDRWLNEVIKSDPDLLFDVKKMPRAWEGVPGHTFNFVPCS